MPPLDDLLREAQAHHDHLCPRQVLGVRMGLLAGQLLNLDLPHHGKRLLTIVETDGCAVDGIIAATNCRVGSRTLRIEDYGKVAATFVDTHTGASIRIVPHPAARQRALALVPDAPDSWHAYLLGYQQMRVAELLTTRWVRLRIPIAQIISTPQQRATCERCSEEISNEREITYEGRVVCRGCIGSSYYHADQLMPVLP